MPEPFFVNVLEAQRLLAKFQGRVPFDPAKPRAMRVEVVVETNTPDMLATMLEEAAAQVRQVVRQRETSPEAHGATEPLLVGYDSKAAMIVIFPQQ